MTLDERKEELKQLALNAVSNGGIIYWMINEGKIDHIIKELTDERTIPNVTSVIKKEFLTGNEQFINVFSELIYYMEKSFLTLQDKERHLSNMLNEYVPEFLLCKKYWGDNSFIPYYDYQIKRLFVENVYENIKFMYHNHEKFFKDMGITTNMSLDDKKVIDKLYKFVVDLVWCNCKTNQWYFNSVFSNHKTRIKDLIDYYKKSEDEATHIILESYTPHWGRLIENYNKNIDLIKQIS